VLQRIKNFRMRNPEFAEGSRFKDRSLKGGSISGRFSAQFNVIFQKTSVENWSGRRRGRLCQNIKKWKVKEYESEGQ